MKVIERLRTWWQVQTGEEETPFDRDSTAFVSSLVFHLVLLMVLGFAPLLFPDNQVSLTITTPHENEPELEVPEEFFFSEQATEEMGANSVDSSEMALATAEVVSDVSEIPSPVDLIPTEVAQIQINNVVQLATAQQYDNLPVKGAAGEGTTGAMGAIDRLTHEILLSLEERKTLVVWLFDQSASMERQRSAIKDRFNRIYHELGVIEAADNPAFKRHDDKPLLTMVMAFGENVSFRLDEPTDNLAEIKEAVEGVERDPTGIENVFSAVYMAADKYKGHRIPNRETREPRRNVMLIVVSDEAGDDVQGLEPTINLCRRYAMPVHVVGVPSPFGRRETMLKWVDPDPEYDQTPQWGIVEQGPESFLPERLNLSFSGGKQKDTPIDSGFGPFHLTRLSYETGGIYFAVHPNRNVNRAINRNEVAEFSAHLEHFFDPRIMRRYRPDYVSGEEYMRRVNRSKARQALLKAAQMSWLSPMESPQLRFVKRSEAELSSALTDAQRGAAKLEPKINALYQTLQLGEADRDKEQTPRWQAGYDLAMGRVMAVKVRTEAYNAMLAAAKRGLKFKDEENNTWQLEPDDDISVGSQLAKQADTARMYLQRVVEDHPNTPWALLAERELKDPLGWKWTEEYTDLAPRNQGAGGGNNNNAASDDERRMLERRPPKRALPKL